MSDYLNPFSDRLLAASLSRNAQAILITGPAGIGLKTATQRLTGHSQAQIIKLLPQKDEKVDQVNGVITVDQIRQIYHMIRTSDAKGRLILVDDADKMGLPAQNAFLKLLEEPPSGVRFILLTHQPQKLIATVVSRLECITLRPISGEQSRQLLNDLGVTDETWRTRLLFIASGLPAELTKLVTDKKYYEARAQIVKDARDLISASAYQRLVLVNKYRSSRAEAILLLEDAMRQLSLTLAAASSNDSSSRSSQTAIEALASLETVHARITTNGNLRLQLSTLAAI